MLVMPSVATIDLVAHLQHTDPESLKTLYPVVYLYSGIYNIPASMYSWTFSCALGAMIDSHLLVSPSTRIRLCSRLVTAVSVFR